MLFSASLRMRQTARPPASSTASGIARGLGNAAGAEGILPDPPHACISECLRADRSHGTTVDTDGNIDDSHRIPAGLLRVGIACDLHRAVGQKVAALAEDGREVRLITVGNLGEEIARGAAESLPTDCIFVSHDTAPYDAVVHHLKDILREGDTVLFKASRAMTLEVIAAAIRSKE